MSLFLLLLASPYLMEQVKAVSATTFELPIKQMRRMIEFSENVCIKICIISSLSQYICINGCKYRRCL